MSLLNFAFIVLASFIVVITTISIFLWQKHKRERKDIEDNIQIGYLVRFYVIQDDDVRINQGRIHWIDRETKQCSIKAVGGVYVVDFKHVYYLE